ncbi:NAC transcription factor ONAC010-like [Bidens hawaiensis]|uniref:NAC transcription factor ONAC010-like n=1 Tax=Bidens hawaiensis TaxID=980011 RepID=UPI0040497384
MDGEQQIIRSSSQEDQPDYADSLEPGYRFCPTDSELIVHCLKKKIETGNHPKCRLHEVNLYDHHPQELSELYLSHENKWYFLTSRDRKYPKGDLPNRKTKNFGSWKASQRYTTVYNKAREAVGSKRSLAYYDDKGKKTSWLMHEYITNDPNLPIGSDGNKLSDCVLCEVYKKEPGMILTDDNKRSRQIQNRRNQEQDQLDDEPPTRRRRVLAGNLPNGPEHFPNSTRDVEISTPVSWDIVVVVGGDDGVRWAMVVTDASDGWW